MTAPLKEPGLRLRCFLGIFGSLAVMITGCGRQSSTSVDAPARREWLVIFSQCNNAEPYRAAQNRRMEELFTKVPGVKLAIYDGQADAAKQISQIENAIRQKPDLLIVAPLQRDSLTKVMGEAMAAQIPTLCLERDIVEPNYTSWIRCDNFKIGQMAGQWIVDHLKAKYGEPRGNLIEIRGMQGVEGAIHRHGGAHSVLTNYPKIKVVHDATANWFQPQAMDRMTEALNANPSGVDVVYAHNDPMAYGAYLAAKEKGREKEMVFVGVDGLPHEGAKYVEQGVLGVTFEYPLCVDKAVEIGTRLLQEPGFKPEKTYLMESRIIARAGTAAK
ncbi:MAG: substrate-binding domain-containing protein [Verrucomicrobiales bacterium]|nr:substrate-binding domain-containing protein [Verrucomicrobiales bacterium]